MAATSCTPALADVARPSRRDPETAGPKARDEVEDARIGEG